MPGNICRVCAFEPQAPPWGASGRVPTYGYCPCCGAQFGVTDNSEDQIVNSRKIWIDAGFPWDSSTTPPPENWDPMAQLRTLPYEFIYSELEPYLEGLLEETEELEDDDW